MGSNRRYSPEQLAPAPRPNEILFYTVEEWSADGGAIVETLGRLASFGMAVVAYDAAVKEKPNSHITMRNRAHVYRDSREKTAGLP